jgi:hypothetical protein
MSQLEHFHQQYYDAYFSHEYFLRGLGNSQRGHDAPFFGEREEPFDHQPYSFEQGIHGLEDVFFS